MKSGASIVLVALAAKVSGHAIFQELWVDGVDMISPPSRARGPPALLTVMARRTMCSHAGVQHARHQRRWR